MKAWLKGGLIGAVVYILYKIIRWCVGAIKLKEMVGGTFFESLKFTLLLAFGVGGNWILGTIIFFVGVITYIVIGFIIGALIGWIVGKIKSKKTP